MFHSYSMINEPNVHQDLYTDAVVIMTAETKEQALDLLIKKDGRWLVEELRRLEPKVFDCGESGIVFEDVRGN
jgi:hypothetical protein